MVFDIAFSQLLRMFTLEFLEQIGGTLPQVLTSTLSRAR